MNKQKIELEKARQRCINAKIKHVEDFIKVVNGEIIRRPCGLSYDPETGDIFNPLQEEIDALSHRLDKFYDHLGIKPETLKELYALEWWGENKKFFLHAVDYTPCDGRPVKDPSLTRNPDYNQKYAQEHFAELVYARELMYEVN